MNPFLYEKFPISYLRVYKILIQTEGREVIVTSLKKILSGHRVEDIIESYQNERLSIDIYHGLQALKHLVDKGYTHIFQPLIEQKDPLIINEMIDGIVLQLNESDRWESKYGGDKKQFDLVLAIPKWSRVVVVSTSEIVPLEMVNKIKQFDNICLKNYHFYEFFNKLHGVAGRTVTITEQRDKYKINNLRKLNFLLRNTKDIKKIAISKNVRLFTPVPDINGIPRISFYFAMICKVVDVKDFLVADGTGIDPYIFKLVCSDEFGSLEIRLNSNIFNKYIRKKYLEREFNELFGSMVEPNTNINHPIDLKDFDGYLLIVGNWFLGDDFPNVSYVVCLNSDINFLKYQMLGYVNTRKKIHINDKEKYRKTLNEISGSNEGLITDTCKQWWYYIDKNWDEKIFRYILENGFKDHKMHELLKRNISLRDLKSCKEDISIYFRINDYVKRLYLSDDPSTELERIYEELDPKTKNNRILESPITSFEILKEENIESNKIDFRTTNRWKVLRSLIPRLMESGYTIEDIFSWDNGGKSLSRIWEKTSHRIPVMSELPSVLYFILQSRGQVNLPYELLNFKNSRKQ